MTPFADFTYFGVLLYVLLPSLVLGMLGRLTWHWVLIATGGMLVVQYWSLWTTSSSLSFLPIQEIWVVAAYAVLCWMVAAVFLRVRSRTDRRGPFYMALGLTLTPLAVVKLEGAFAPATPVGFLGLSYITFRALDVVLGVQDKLIPSLPIGQYVGYLLFFPTISSGPIDRYRRFVGDWCQRRDRSQFLQDLDGAVHHVFTGFLYKFIVAALIKLYWLDPAAEGGGRLQLISYMYAYSLYLFFDFAGYSAFAVGLSYIFGIRTPENFQRPFAARNIREFWNRWHISLSWWFRDQIYMRFVYAATRGRWFRGRYTSSHLGFFLTFGLMGLWHGLQPYYLLYGLYHASLQVGYDLFGRWNRKHQLWGDGPIWHLAGILVTFNLVCLGFLLFSARLGPHWPGH